MAKFGYTPLQRDRTMAVMFLRRTHGDAPTTGANQAVTRRTIVKLSLFYSGTMPLVQDPFQPMRQSILDLSRQIPQGTAHNTQGSLCYRAWFQARGNLVVYAVLLGSVQAYM